MSQLARKIAFRYILSKKSHSAVNLISIVAICGIIVTTIAMICVLSVFNGFSRVIEEKLSAIDPDIKVCATTGKHIDNADQLAATIREIPGVAYALPVIEERALAEFSERQLPVMLKGVTDDYANTCSIASKVKDDGRYLLSDSICNYAVVSVGVAAQLMAHPGYYRHLALYAPKRVGKINLNNPTSAFRADTLFISGVFQIDQADYDTSTIIVPLDVARHLFSYTDEATAIEVTATPDTDISRLIGTITHTIGDGYKVNDRLMQQQASFRMINIEKWITFLLLGFILIIATFNVISSISVLIVEKQSAIAILSTLGATQKLIRSIFMWQTLFIGVAGAVIGSIIGTAACIAQQHFGFIKIGGNPGTMIVDAYPVAVEASDVIAILLISIVISAIAAIGVSAIARTRT